MLIRVLITLCIPALISTAALAQQYYRWVDENGTVHFSESPPASGESESGTVRDSHITRGLSGSSTASSPAPGDSAADPSASAEDEPADAENCAKVRNNLETLNASPQVQKVDPETGEARLMTTEEHRAEIERNRRLEDIYC